MKKNNVYFRLNCEKTCYTEEYYDQLVMTILGIKTVGIEDNDDPQQVMDFYVEECQAEHVEALARVLEMSGSDIIYKLG